jgi:nitronate monooxygenase
LAVCCEEKIAFIITSLGSPKETIEIAHQHGVLVKTKDGFLFI